MCPADSLSQARRLLDLAFTEELGRTHVRLRLSEDGRTLAEGAAAVDTADEEYAAFVATGFHLRMRQVADRVAVGGEELARRIGSWLSESLLGSVAPHIAGCAPCTVVVHGSAPLREGPLALALVSGRTLAEHGVVFVESMDGAPAPPDEPASRSPLRMLAVLSQPDGLDAMNLRKERRHLQRTVRNLVEAHGLDVELRVLQYGVTHKVLAEVAADPRGWDIVHLSGHGTTQTFVLESEDTGRDPIAVDDLVSLLVPARPRLLVVTSCQAAGQAADEWTATPDPPPTRREVRGLFGPALARAAARTLGCAVVAMRLAVSDDFAIAFTAALYEGVMVDGLPVAQALGEAREKAAAQGGLLEWATPTLLGARSAHLTFRVAAVGEAPAARRDLLPAEPKHFVGRVGILTRCGRALADESGPRTVILHGLPGAGKTATAAELVHRHQDRFDHVLWYAVQDTADPEAALADLSVHLEAVLPGLRLVHLIGTEEFVAAMRDLTSALASARVLLAVDNLESLVRDGRVGHRGWSALLTAMADHDGPSRLVLTTRAVPEGFAATMVEHVGLLRQSEIVVLINELPNLARFLRGEVPGLDPRTARKLADRVITAVGGHPKLLELAEGQAVDGAQLRRLVNTGELVHPELSDGGDETAFLTVLSDWTARAASTLSPSARLRFDVLCMLHERDRRAEAVSAVCAGLDARQSALSSGDRELEATALVALEGAPGEDGLGYSMHPAVVAAGRGLLGPDSSARLLEAITRHWTSAIEEATAGEREGGSVDPVASRARSALAYLLESGNIRAATDALDLVLRRVRSRASLRSLIPLAGMLHKAATEPRDQLRAGRLWANTLALTDAIVVAERLTAQLRAEAMKQDNLEMATVLTSDLISRYRDSGRYAEALTLAEEQIELGRQVGVGPWTQLLHDNERVNLMVTMRQRDEAAPLIDELLTRMRRMPDEPGDNETVRPFWVRELILDTAYTAALAGRDYRACLRVGKEMITSKKNRGADEAEITRAVYRICYPLMRTDRLEEAALHLDRCRQVFVREHDVVALAATYSALAEIEEARGRPRAGAELGRASLRYQYRGRTIGGIVNGHLNLGYRLRATGARRGATAHHLLASMIATAIGHWYGDSAARALVEDLSAVRDGRAPFTTIEELWQTVAEDLPEFDVREELRALRGGSSFEQADMDAALATARADTDALLRPAFAFWDPALSGLLAADPEAVSAAGDFLDAVAGDSGWAALAEALRTPGLPVPEGLDEVDTAVYERALAMHRGDIAVGAELWRALPWADSLANVVGATYGRTDRSAPAVECLNAMADEAPDLTDRLRAVLDGEREHLTLLAGLSAADHAAVVCTLQHAHSRPTARRS